MSKTLTPDEALAVLAKIPADSPTGRALRETMGDAPSYEAARDAAVAEIQRRMDDRMAVL